MPIDYSKFNNIVDSDDDKEEVKETITKKDETPRAKCGNCGATPDKLRTCSICKKAGYCSEKCQRDDWKFHKRNCAAKKDKKDAPPKKKKQQQAAKKSNVVTSSDNASSSSDEDAAPISWYKHRETKLPPSSSGPSKLDSVDAASPSERCAGSVWNTAGTWEERDVFAWAKKKLDCLVGLKRDFGAGVVEVTEVSEVTGDASVGNNRGKTKHIFDLSFKLRIKVNGTITGKLLVKEFTHDLDDPLILTFSVTDAAPSFMTVLTKSVGASEPHKSIAEVQEPKSLADDLLLALRDTFMPAFNAL